MKKERAACTGEGGGEETSAAPHEHSSQGCGEKGMISPFFIIKARSGGWRS